MTVVQRLLPVELGLATSGLGSSAVVRATNVAAAAALCMTPSKCIVCSKPNRQGLSIDLSTIHRR